MRPPPQIKRRRSPLGTTVLGHGVVATTASRLSDYATKAISTFAITRIEVYRRDPLNRSPSPGLIQLGTKAARL